GFLFASLFLLFASFQNALAGPRHSLPEAPSGAATTVNLPTADLDTSIPVTTVVMLPVNSTATDPALNFVGFQGDFIFDSSVLTSPPPYVAAGDVTANDRTVAGNVIDLDPPHPPLKALRVSAFANGLSPLSGAGSLYKIQMIRMSNTTGANTTLTWRPAPSH